MELKGKVVLDEESMDMLRNEIRKEVISDIEKNGCEAFEIEKFMKNCNFKTYLKLIERTISNVVCKVDENNLFSSEWKIYRKLLAIKAIMDI